MADHPNALVQQADSMKSSLKQLCKDNAVIDVQNGLRIDDNATYRPITRAKTLIWDITGWDLTLQHHLFTWIWTQQMVQPLVRDFHPKKDQALIEKIGLNEYKKTLTLPMQKN